MLLPNCRIIFCCQARQPFIFLVEFSYHINLDDKPARGEGGRYETGVPSCALLDIS